MLGAPRNGKGSGAPRKPPPCTPPVTPLGTMEYLISTSYQYLKYEKEPIPKSVKDNRNTGPITQDITSTLHTVTFFCKLNG